MGWYKSDTDWGVSLFVIYFDVIEEIHKCQTYTFGSKFFGIDFWSLDAISRFTFNSSLVVSSSGLIENVSSFAHQEQ